MLNTVREQLASEQLQAAQQVKELQWAVKVCLFLVDHPLFIGLTTCLTIYALIGDDVRMVSTDKPDDDYFNVATLVCLGIFAIEITMSCVGKEDYFMGFFFLLDVISTMSLVLDLTWVNDALMGEDEYDPEHLKISMTARLGARSARIIRVIRLVRLVKLYKAVLKLRSHYRPSVSRLKYEWEEFEEELDEDERMAPESRVGKRLSELTTRRVIVSVLTMLLVLPLLSLDEREQLPTTAAYGANVVQAAFEEAQAAAVVGGSGSDAVSRREAYERALLQYVYYHNWYSIDCPDDSLCPSDFDNTLFWVGMRTKSDDEDALAARARSASLNGGANQVDDWELSEGGLGRMYSYGGMPSGVQGLLGSSWDTACASNNYRMHGFSLLEENFGGMVNYRVRCPTDLRIAERKQYYPNLVSRERHDMWHFVFYFDRRAFVKKERIASMLLTAFVGFVLCGASALFAMDANRLVLKPVESMMLKVHMIRINPLMAVRLADDAFRQEEVAKANRRRESESVVKQIQQKFCCKGNRGERKQPLETAVLEATIVKLGTLLALGFGMAGMDIISNVMRKDSVGIDASQTVGAVVKCIVGRVRIANFSIATEVLHINVMTFVNQIAEIVHGTVDELHGAPSRNSGDTFLVVWGELDQVDLSRLADMAVLAFARILGAVNRSAVLATYQKHPGFQQRLGTRCRVNLTFSLHFGWAIEGALGTEFKIDASYLSPHVSVAENVEEATVAYGVNILVTEALHELCTPTMAEKCRRIDCVKVMGANKRMDLLTLDLRGELLTVEQPLGDVRWNSYQRFRARQFIEAEKGSKLGEYTSIPSLFDESADVSAMRAPYTVEFFQLFAMGLCNYTEGQWSAAQNLLLKTRDMLGFEDGPSAALLRIMGGAEAPKGWAGFHDLVDVPLPSPDHWRWQRSKDSVRYSLEDVPQELSVGRPPTLASARLGTGFPGEGASQAAAGQPASPPSPPGYAHPWLEWPKCSL